MNADEEKDVVLFQVLSGGIGLITLNRPTRLNALTQVMQEDYFDRLDQAANDPQVKVIVVTGSGKAFCAGADMKLLQTLQDKDAEAKTRTKRSVEQIQALEIPKPIIAAVNGPCAGLGFVLACMCDIRFTVDGAKFTSAFAKRGLVAEHGISWILPRVVGMSNAMDILLSSRVFLGREAKDLGLVSKSFPDQDTLMKETLQYARDMARLCSPASLAEMKSQLIRHYNYNPQDSFQESKNLMLQSFKHPDFKEGVDSYVDRRAPAFQGLQFGRISKI